MTSPAKAISIARSARPSACRMPRFWQVLRHTRIAADILRDSCRAGRVSRLRPTRLPDCGTYCSTK
jgi:hypothetical protein